MSSVGCQLGFDVRTLARRAYGSAAPTSMTDPMISPAPGSLDYVSIVMSAPSATGRAALSCALDRLAEHRRANRRWLTVQALERRAREAGVLGTVVSAPAATDSSDMPA